jgi:hypothetical protein
MSWIWTKLALPITRLAMRRPATLTRRASDSNFSVVHVSASAYSASRSPA